MKKIQNGRAVTYVDEHGESHAALVTQTWGKDGTKEYDEKNACLSINLAYVSGNLEDTDSYGTQIKRETSVCHQSNQSAPGRYWYQA
jgi:hypothetical protein